MHLGGALEQLATQRTIARGVNAVGGGV